MLKKLVQLFGGDPNKRAIDKYSHLVDQINALEPDYEKLSREALAAKTKEFRARLADGETLDDLMIEAFATVREASKRTIGLRHYDVQLIGGMSMHQGTIAEMRTGEGKTLVATLPLYLNALAGKGAHLITVNDYLARRDARWMAPIYDLLGMSVGVLQMAARTENGRKAFLVDLEKESPHEDQHQLDMVPRRMAYKADITYGTNSEFGFDYLRDNMTMSVEERVQRGHFYAIIDEVDNVLIDEARTPLIISGPAQDEGEWYQRMAQVVRQLRPEDYEVNEKDRTVTLTEIGETHVEELLGVPLRDPDRPEDVTLEQMRLLGYLEQGLRAQFLFRRNKDYLVQGGKVVIIDEFTGRLMPGRRWSDGLHQAVEAKEGVKIESESVTYATITIQNYFRMYEKLAGMTGTALTEAEEFKEIYDLDVLAIPTNLEYRAQRSDDLERVESRDEEGYKYEFYIRQDDSSHEPVFWKRQDYPDVVYRTEEAKLRAIVLEILRFHTLGRPLLVGTTSVELSEQVSSRLRSEPLRRLAQVMILRQHWLMANDREEDGRLIEELQFMNVPLNDLPIAEMRKMARDLDISFNPADERNMQVLLNYMNLPPSAKERLVADLDAGIAHEVLNARKHTEESQIIAGAGAFGAVTIATNMAGRGVDIKLGGEIAEEVLASVNRLLAKNDFEDPYSMTMEERLEALQRLSPEDYGIYESEVRFMLQYMEDMERVRDLGGLHVIGSERHEARRIDNQLRGRAARQGDPGSSRFYLSMEDDLMRLFGGGQADALMQRLKIDEALPLEVGLVSRLVEQSQTRVEGANFDVRKHLLEYDDVLNSQRVKIYGQRNRIFSKDDLSDDVLEMLRTEVNRRVPQALESEDEPWKLLAWLDQIQPPLQVGETVYPSYTLRLLLDHVMGGGERTPTETISRQEASQGLLAIASSSIDAEEEHLLDTVDDLLRNNEDRLEEQIAERIETLDTFIEGLELEDEEISRSPAETADELVSLLRLPLRLSSQTQKELVQDPAAVREEIEQMVETMLTDQAITRLIGAVERRLEESLDLDTSQMESDWQELADEVLSAIQSVYNRRRERYLGEEGFIPRDIEKHLDRINSDTITRQQVLSILSVLPLGAKAVFDKKTHRRVWQRTTRLSYVYYAGEFLENIDPEEVTIDVLDHLVEAQQAIQRSWGLAEFKRLSDFTLEALEEGTRQALRQALGETRYDNQASQTLGSLDGEDRATAIDTLGRRAVTALYRQLMLRVITELWVDYLTQMEALRVSIGLEAYAQRDPLVQYKSRAFALFQELLTNMRSGVANRMFTYRPSDLESVRTSVREDGQNEKLEIETAATEQEPVSEPAAAAVAQESGDGRQGRDGGGRAKKKSGRNKPLSSSAKRRRNRR